MFRGKTHSTFSHHLSVPCLVKGLHGSMIFTFGYFFYWTVDKTGLSTDQHGVLEIYVIFLGRCNPKKSQQKKLQRKSLIPVRVCCKASSNFQVHIPMDGTPQKGLLGSRVYFLESWLLCTLYRFASMHWALFPQTKLSFLYSNFLYFSK